ncbi:MAG: hypothetical protein PVF73_05690, partial [Bacteroidales bacterium]
MYFFLLYTKLSIEKQKYDSQIVYVWFVYALNRPEEFFMADKKVHRVLSKCKREIIYKFSGNYSYQLKHTDFLLLSDEIAEASKITLSLTTLRRIFKDEYKGIPKISTLNAFALYLGYENWKEYYKQNQTEDHNTPEPVSSKRKYLPSFFIILVSGILVIAVILLIIKPEILFESV